MENKIKDKDINSIGQVIRIISNEEIIIDVGNFYLTIGDKVIIYQALDEIFDLEGNSLGFFENQKAIMDVIHTTDNYSVCAILKEENIPLFGLPTMTRTITKNAPLNIDENDISPLKGNIHDKKIRIGDFVQKG